MIFRSLQLEIDPISCLIHLRVMEVEVFARLGVGLENDPGSPAKSLSETP